MNRIKRYFDLRIPPEPLAGLPGREETPKKFPVLPQYLALVAGIVIQPFFESYRATGVWAFGDLPGWFVFALIAGVVIFPAVYKRSFDVDKPIVVQLAAIFTSGVGYKSFLNVALQAATGGDAA